MNVLKVPDIEKRVNMKPNQVTIVSFYNITTHEIPQVYTNRTIIQIHNYKPLVQQGDFIK